MKIFTWLDRIDRIFGTYPVHPVYPCYLKRSFTIAEGDSDEVNL